MASSSTPEKTTKNSATERFLPLTYEDVERFVEAEANQKKHSKKDAQRRSIDEVAFAKWKQNSIQSVQFNISRVSVANEFDIALNTRREIPYHCAPMYYCPFLDKISLIYIPYPRLNHLNTMPFTAAHTCIAYILE